jgi:ectoine hydroxylase-related dioxygenase (phytanoyl-CoA dioxygenase family)
MTTTRSGSHPFALTADQRAAFEEQGFLVLRDQLPADALDALRRAFTVAVDRQVRAWHAAGALDDLHEDLDFDARFRRVHEVFDRRVPGSWRKILVTPETYGMWQRPELLGPVRSLLGDEVQAHGIWNGRPRMPGDHAQQVTWHQDAHYYRDWGPTDSPLVSAWMPLVPVDETSSCLQFVVGSHRLGRVERLRAQTGHFTVSDEVLAGREVCTAAMEPGDVVLFSDTTLHQSTRNESQRIRWSLDIRFCAATPALVAKSPRGYRCCSTDPAQVEPFETWAARYDYNPAELVDELENFAGLDADALRDLLARTPERLDVY